ncbi:MAG: stage II sporulation protein R [Clostridia bacterium]|nr:stage II sporulation protein R [Clostridia bacterium]
MKKIIVALFLGIAITGYITTYCETVKSSISKSVVRLHVVANSNSPFDQQLKLEVRDRIIEYLSKLDLKSAEHTKEIIKQNKHKITKIANDVVSEKGFCYPVKCETGIFMFPTKSYGDAKLPKGEYYALRVEIGDALGENWWCVLYPQLCFSEFGEESKAKLKETLNQDEYDLVTQSEKYKFKFMLMELLEK